MEENKYSIIAKNISKGYKMYSSPKEKLLDLILPEKISFASFFVILGFLFITSATADVISTATSITAPDDAINMLDIKILVKFKLSYPEYKSVSEYGITAP